VAVVAMVLDFCSAGSLAGLIVFFLKLIKKLLSSETLGYICSNK